MKLKTNWLRGFLAGSIIVTVAMLASPALAQDKDAHGSGQAKGGAPAKSGGHGGSVQAKSSGAKRQMPARSGQSSAPTARRGTTAKATRTSSTRSSPPRSGNSARTKTTSHGSGSSRPMRMQAGRPMSASSWRSSNPNWNGGYYYHNGGYYYDTAFSYPAIMVNEWGAIAALAGGVALLSVLNNDPTLVFVGSVGAVYSYSQYQLDLHSSDPEIRLRASYFSKPYFWRNGVRFDRITVTIGGVNSYQFRRH